MDRLSALFQHFELRGSMFYSGQLCGVSDFSAEEHGGHLHLLRSGELSVVDENGSERSLRQPSVIFYPRPANHRIRSLEGGSADLVCASVNFGGAEGNPLMQALPQPLIVPLQELPREGAAIQLLFAEAFGDACGHEAAVNRLIEVVLIELLRFVMTRRSTDTGLLAALANPQLAEVMVAIHAHPGKAWDLDAMSQLANMSRSRFATHFKSTVGLTPGEYLTQWRIVVAQKALRRGRPINLTAEDVGYSNASALTRLFRQHLGLSPRQWLQSQTAAS